MGDQAALDPRAQGADLRRRSRRSLPISFAWMRLFSHVLLVVVPAYSAPDVMLLLNPPVAERSIPDLKVVIDLG